MRQQAFFSPSRFWRLLKLELFRSRKVYFMAFIVTFGMLITGFTIENLISSQKVFNEHPGSYAFFLILGGFILSSLAFADLGNPMRRYSYLMLPASALEKLLSMWLLTCIGWILLFTLTFAVYAMIANSAGHFFFRDVIFENFNLMAPSTLKAMGYFVLFQGIFLAGAAHFRGYTFAKTLFTIMLFAIVCGLFFYLIMARILSSADQCPPDYNPFTEAPVRNFLQVVSWLAIFIVAPLSWVITFFALKEQEA